MATDLEEFIMATNRDLACSICLESINIPKILSCGHSFCRECLKTWIDGKDGKFPCPFCKQEVKIPQGGVDNFITNFSLKTLIDSSHSPRHYCPNHITKEVEFYCQTCTLGLCSRCILKEHTSHERIDLELSSTREMVVKELSKSEQCIINKLKDLEKDRATLLETSEKLKLRCDEACTKIIEKTEKIIRELKENCEKSQKTIRDNFVKTESQMKGILQKVITQINSIETDLDTSIPTTTDETTLTLIYSWNKLQDVQKRCENTKTDIPPVTYVEWREGVVNIRDIFGTTVTKTL